MRRRRSYGKKYYYISIKYCCWAVSIVIKELNFSRANREKCKKILDEHGNNIFESREEAEKCRRKIEEAFAENALEAARIRKEVLNSKRE